MLENPRTSFAGLIGAIGLGLQAIDGLPPALRAGLFVISAIAIAAMGLLSRDRHELVKAKADDADPPPVTREP